MWPLRAMLVVAAEQSSKMLTTRRGCYCSSRAAFSASLLEGRVSRSAASGQPRGRDSSQAYVSSWSDDLLLATSAGLLTRLLSCLRTTPGGAAGGAFKRWGRLLAGAIARHGVAREQARAIATLAIASIERAIVVSRGQRSSAPLRRASCVSSLRSPPPWSTLRRAETGSSRASGGGARQDAPYGGFESREWVDDSLPAWVE
jgi:hypothetical protein